MFDEGDQRAPDLHSYLNRAKGSDPFCHDVAASAIKAHRGLRKEHAKAGAAHRGRIAGGGHGAAARLHMREQCAAAAGGCRQLVGRRETQLVVKARHLQAGAHGGAQNRELGIAGGGLAKLRPLDGVDRETTLVEKAVPPKRSSVHHLGAALLEKNQGPTCWLSKQKLIMCRRMEGAKPVTFRKARESSWACGGSAASAGSTTLTRLPGTLSLLPKSRKVTCAGRHEESTQ